jgi:hypothetical protein
MHPILQEVQRHTDAQPELLVQPQFLEPEEVLLQLLGKVTTNELLTPIVEFSIACRTALGRQGWPKQLSKVRLHALMQRA